MGNNPVSPTELTAALDDLLSQAIAKEAQRVRIDNLRDTDWTVERVMKEHNLTDSIARKVLRKMVKDGIAFEIRVTSAAGVPCKAWRQVETQV